MDEVIDIHCHVIPGVDDGSSSMEESVSLLKAAYQQGVRSVIATPHYSRRSQNVDRHAQQEQLRTELELRARAEIDPAFRVYLGQEAYYHVDLPERIRDGFGWPMAGSRYLLIEFDTRSDYETIFRGLRSVRNEGYTPILAHIERFPSIRRKGGIDEIRSLGVKMQMNYESLEGSIFSGEVRWCRDQVRNGVVDVMGSDMHRLDFRPPNITGGLGWMRKHLSEDEFQRLTRDNPMRIIQDQDLL
ncbi:MAG: protein tyrosine phosphatase [Lachnospiraceae bacterium]|nr:protein tyrosine phosphatase [Lachnospiraceae bacterium]